MKRLTVILVFMCTYGYGQTKEDYLKMGDLKWVNSKSKHDYIQAIKYYTKAIKLDSNYAEAYSMRGYCKNEFLKDYNGAIKDYIKAIELEPEAYLYENRAYSKFSIGDKKGACLDWQKAADIAMEGTKAIRDTINKYCK